MPPAKLTSTKRFAVRLSLVTGSTLATIIGAQNLAAIDKQTTPTPDPTIFVPEVQPTLTADPLVFSGDTTGNTPTADSSTVEHVAPSITILRRSGQPGASTSANVNIQPPAPVQITAPEPVIVQAPSSPTVIQVPGAAAPAAAPASRPATRSSRR